MVKYLKLEAPLICCEAADQNQYNKLLGLVRITVREFGSDRIHYSKLLEIMTSSNFTYLTIRTILIRKTRTVNSHISK